MTNSSGNLLQTIMADPRLSRGLAELPSDAKTVTLQMPAAAATFSHPSWDALLDGGVDDPDGLAKTRTLPDERLIDSSPHDRVVAKVGCDATTQTLRLTSDSERSVPVRRVAKIGDGKGCEAEYRLVGQLGSGGTGVVYQAHQRAIDREVAVKSLRVELLGDRQSRDRFLTEARVIGGLDHPNVIALHELCMDETGGLFYSMKRIDGSSWDQQLASMTLDENLRVLLRVADAIRYAHSRGLVHRDIKPENVMLGRFGEVLLADWGLAVSHGPEELSDEIDPTIGGTPAYMAPELAIGDPSMVTFQTDVYLIGAILFQILTGHPPHHGENLLACIHAAANNLIRPTDVGGELMEIAMQAMSTDPAERHASVDAFIAAIEDQQIHRQSISLVRRAERILAEAPAPDPGAPPGQTLENRYEPFRLADAILREAIEAWPGNKHAHRAIIDLQRNYASVAAANGDLDLALALYEACGEGETEVALRIRRRRDQRNEYQRGQAKYSALFTQSPEAGLLLRLSNGEILEANESFLNLLGVAAADIVGSRMPELNVWRCPRQREKFVRDVQRDGRVDNFEAVFLRSDGSPIDVLISARTTDLEDEKVLLSTIRDISLRKQAENSLRQSRARLRDLQRLAGLGTWSYDITTEEIQWSEETFQLVGCDTRHGPLDFPGYLATLHPEDAPRLQAVVAETIRSGTAYELQIRQGLASDVQDGVPVEKRSYRTAIARGQPMTDADGRIIEIYGVLIPTGPIETSRAFAG